MVGPLGESLIKALKEGKLKPKSKAEVDEERARLATISDEELARWRKEWDEEIAKSSLDDWGV